MKDLEQTRRDVSADYARALKSQGSACCGDSVPKGALAQIAGYSDADLAALPAKAVIDSFGCGNPLNFSEIQPGQVVLDLGSGAGIDLLLAAKKVGAGGKAIGVDMTEEMIVKARENIAAAKLGNAEVRKGIIEELPVDDASVDWVISNCVINLSPEKHRVFAEIARVLRPGGTMLVADIAARDLPGDISENRQIYSSCLAGAISEEAYVNGLRDAGLVKVEIIDRLVYDTAQLEMLIGSELQDAGSSCCRGTSTVSPELARRWAEELSGRVASIKVRARRAG